MKIDLFSISYTSFPTSTNKFHSISYFLLVRNKNTKFNIAIESLFSPPMQQSLSATWHFLSMHRASKTNIPCSIHCLNSINASIKRNHASIKRVSNSTFEAPCALSSNFPSSHWCTVLVLHSWLETCSLFWHLWYNFWNDNTQLHYTTRILTTFPCPLFI